MLENKPIPNITLLALCFWKMLFYALILKNLDKQSFFMVNSSKAGMCHICFINRVDRYHSHSINKSADRRYSYTTSKKAIYR